MPTLKQLIARRDKAEEALAKETERIHNVLDNQGWGHGMRCSHTGCSFKKEDKLKERIRNLNAQIAEMKEKEKEYIVAEEYLHGETGDVDDSTILFSTCDEKEAQEYAENHVINDRRPTQVAIWEMEDGSCRDSWVVKRNFNENI